METEGFAILPDLFAPQFLDRITHEIDRPPSLRSRAGIRHAMRLGPVAELARDPRLMEVASAILGPEAFPFRATVFDKSPRANWLVAWHQDTVLPIRERKAAEGWNSWSIKDGIHYARAPAAVLSRILALRLHLNDSNADNGPLRVIPRTHNLGVLTDDALLELSGRIQAIDCTATQGAVVAMRPLIVHASSKSSTHLPRRVLHIEYAASPSAAEPLTLATA